MSVILGTAYVTIGAVFKSLSFGLSSAFKATSGILHKITGAFSSAFGEIKRISGIGGLGIGASIGYGVKKFADFERQLASVSTMLDASAMPIMKQYRTALEDMAVGFGESTQTLSKGLYDILSASVPAGDALDVLQRSATAAVAGMSSTAKAADLLTTTLNAFQLPASRAADISDIMFATVKKGKLTFDELADSFGEVASISALTGMSLQQITASLAAVTRAGIKLSEATVALRAYFQALIDPQEDAVKVARQHGIDMSLERIRAEGLIPVLQEMQSLSVKEINSLAGRIRGFKGLAAMLMQAKQLQGDLNFMMHAGGRTAEAYGKIVDTVSMRFARFKERVTKAFVAIGEFAVKVWDRMAVDLRAVYETMSDTLGQFGSNLRRWVESWLGPISTWKDTVLAMWDAVLERLATIDIPIRKMATLFRSGSQNIARSLQWLQEVAATLGRNLVRIARETIATVLKMTEPIGAFIVAKLADLIGRVTRELQTRFVGKLGTFGATMFLAFKNLGDSLRAALGFSGEGDKRGGKSAEENLVEGVKAALEGTKDSWAKTRAELEAMPLFPIDQMTRELRAQWDALDREGGERAQRLRKLLESMRAPQVPQLQPVGLPIDALRATAIPRAGGGGAGGLAALSGSGVTGPRLPSGFGRGTLSGEDRVAQDQLEELRRIRRELEKQGRDRGIFRQ